MSADPKPAKRTLSPAVLRQFHAGNPSCVACTNGPGFKVEAHHLILRAQGGDDVLENLVGLCTSCHRAFHNGNTAPRRMLARYLRSDAGADHVEYLKRKRGAFGAENYVRRLEGSIDL